MVHQWVWVEDMVHPPTERSTKIVVDSTATKVVRMEDGVEGGSGVATVQVMMVEGGGEDHAVEVQIVVIHQGQGTNA